MAQVACSGCGLLREVAEATAKQIAKTGSLCRSCSGRKVTPKRIPKDATPKECAWEFCNKLFVGNKNRLFCSDRCRNLETKAKTDYFQGLKKCKGLKERVCQLCGRPIAKTSQLHPHHIFGVANSEEMVALDGLCHLLVSKLALRDWGPEQYANLVRLSLWQREANDASDVYVQIERY